MGRMFTLAVAVPILLAAAPPNGGREGLFGVYGLEPGISQAELSERVAKLGSKLACRPSTRNKRLNECTATRLRTPDRGDWSLRASVVDGTTAILNLNGQGPVRQLDQIREEIAAEFGRPNLRSYGSIRTYEWIRDGRLLRVGSMGREDWRELSITMIEGSVLDQLGQDDQGT